MKKIFTLIIALVAGVGTIFAESGNCGKDGSTVKWNLTDGVLIISGEGAMADYIFMKSITLIILMFINLAIMVVVELIKLS